MNNLPQNQQQKAVAKKDSTLSERFMLRVINEFGSGLGEIALSKSQKRLAQNYFHAADSVLKVAEEKRLKKTGKYQDQTPITWQNVNIESLAVNVVSAARIGWDPLEKNHVSMIPYKNNTTQKYDIGFIPGYRGIELKAKKYGLDVPDNITVELVFKNDDFQVRKKDRTNSIESYEFSTPNPFDRGEIVGGFYYHEYAGSPQRNRLVVFSLKEILKRKPKYAGVEFWGGEKDVWEKDDKGKNVKTGKETVEGWFEKMVWKTVYRAAYSDITIDSEKIDDAYQAMAVNDGNLAMVSVEEDYKENANKTVIDITPDPPPENVDTKTGEVRPPADNGEPGSDPARTPEDIRRESMEIDAVLAAAEEQAPY